MSRSGFQARAMNRINSIGIFLAADSCLTMEFVSQSKVCAVRETNGLFLEALLETFECGNRKCGNYQIRDRVSQKPILNVDDHGLGNSKNA